MQQGEDERTLGMPTSAYMDRDNPQVPQLQASFIKHLVQPLYIAYEKAGILPGEWVEGSEEDEEDEDDEEGNDATKKSINDSDDASGEEEDGRSTVKTNNNKKLKDTTDSSATTTPSDDNNSVVTDNDEDTEDNDNSTDKKVRYCIMSDNIKTNYEKWLRIIEEEKEEHSGQQDDDVIDDQDNDGGDTSDDTWSNTRSRVVCIAHPGGVGDARWTLDGVNRIWGALSVVDVYAYNLTTRKRLFF